MAAHATTRGGDHGPKRAEHHVVPIPVYLWVFAALMVLLIVTLVAAAFDLGAWNLPIAMTIAVAKALLVVLYFMHVRYNSRLVWTFAAAGLFWLSILFVLTLTDYLSRGWLETPGK
jgi:cytochrome c oxidase subunit IV